MKTLRHTLTTLSLGLGLLLTGAASLTLGGCQDDLFPGGPGGMEEDAASTKAEQAITSSLIQNNDGTWKPNHCRIPLVGKGRILDDINPGLVTVLATSGNEEKLTNLDLTDAMSFAGVASVTTGEPFLSVRDLNRVYYDQEGMKVGFTYRERDGVNVLNVDVLKTFWIKTYLNGEPQESNISTSTESTNLLELQLLNTSGGLREASIVAKKPFDEVQIGSTGISVEALRGMEVCYAFVGDNPEKIAAEGHEYPEATDDRLPHTLTNSNIGDGPVIELLGSLLGLIIDYSVTFNAETDIEVGSEIGFKASAGGLASLSLGGIKLTLYDKDGTQLEEATLTNGIGVSALGGGENYFSMICTKSGCQKIKITYPRGLQILSAIQTHYAYTRDPVKVDASSYFTAGDVTITGNSYTLPTPEGGKVTWNVLQNVEGTTPTITTTNGVTKIINMTRDGKYVVSGTFHPDGGGDPVTVTFTIERQALTMGEECNILIGQDYKATIAEGGIGEGGALIQIIEGTQYLDNIVDDNPNNYAIYTDVASIAEHSLIVPIEMKNSINSSHQKIKVGFTMQTSFDFLSADVLDFFLIKLYNNGVQVNKGATAADDSNVTDVGLIGSQGNKFRIGIETTEEFDRIELWTAGILSLNLKQYRLYNAYWESAEADCPTNGLLDACMEMLTSANGAEISWEDDDTSIEGLANIGASISNLGNLLDEDKESHATITSTTVLGEQSVAVKFPAMSGPKQIGFIVESPDFVGDVDVLSGIKLTVYNGETEVKETTEGAVADIGLIGNTNRIYVETMITTETFDKVKIEFLSTLSALKTLNLNGVYIRRDSDNDNIPDCADDEENQTETGQLLTANVQNAHACLGDDVVIEVTDGGENGSNYQIVCYNTFLNNKETELNIQLTDNKFVLSNLEAGEYFFRIYQEDKPACSMALEAWVHPKKTTWKTNAGSTDWTAWSNWEDGEPWDCTNVIIPQGCAHYPILNETDENRCNNIYIEDGGQLVRSYYLDRYEKVWVDFNLKSDRYYMLSSPLKDMISGDWFISTGYNVDIFNAINDENYPEQRLTPRIYQRLWSTSAPIKNPSGYQNNSANTVQPDETNWTPPYNAITNLYKPGQGFSLMAGQETGTAYTFRFPKEHTIYHYYNLRGEQTENPESVHSDNQIAGKFIYENATEWNASNHTLTVTLENQKSGNVFLAGNPFTSHIDIQKFMETNGISEIKVYDGNNNNSLILIDGQLMSANGDNVSYIKPMEAFFVTSNSKGTTLQVTFNEEMLSEGGTPHAFTRSASPAPAALRLAATLDGHTAHALLRVSPTASAGVAPGEDTKLLVEGEARPAVAIYTVADGRALDIQQVPADVRRIPLGFYLPGGGKADIRLTPQFTDPEWSDWFLLDLRTGQRRRLTPAAIDLHDVENGSSRYVLVNNEGE